jgi:hypothetical protein
MQAGASFLTATPLARHTSPDYRDPLGPQSIQINLSVTSQPVPPSFKLLLLFLPEFSARERQQHLAAMSNGSTAPGITCKYSQRILAQ